MHSASGNRYIGAGSHPQDGDIRTDLLPLEEDLGGLGPSEVRRLKQLEEENRRLKQMVADLCLDKHMLQDVLSRKL